MAISQKMDELEKELKMAVARKVAEDFKDPLGPLNALTQAALAPVGTLARLFVCLFVYFNVLQQRKYKRTCFAGVFSYENIRTCLFACNCGAPSIFTRKG